MKDYTLLIDQELKENTDLKGQLADYLGSPAVFKLKAKSDVSPRITYFEMINIPDRFSDNRPRNDKLRYQIDLWVPLTVDPFPLKKAVDESMGSLGFIRNFQTELYDEESDLQHIPMRFVKYEEVI